MIACALVSCFNIIGKKVQHKNALIFFAGHCIVRVFVNEMPKQTYYLPIIKININLI